MHVINYPTLPYFGQIPFAVNPGTVIQIDGHIPHHSSKMEINLMKGQQIGYHNGRHGDIALQIVSKLHKKKLICNSSSYGHWGQKEKHFNVYSLHEGSNFSLTIIVEPQYYRIVVNGQHVCNFAHRVSYHEINTLNIEGHVSIHKIEIRSSAMPAMPVATAYQPAVPTSVYPTAPPPYATPTVYVPTATPSPVYVQAAQPVPQTIVIERSRPPHGIIGAILDHNHHHHHHHGHRRHHW